MVCYRMVLHTWMVVTRSVCVMVCGYLTYLYLRRMFVEYSDWNMYTQNTYIPTVYRNRRYVHRMMVFYCLPAGGMHRCIFFGFEKGQQTHQQNQSYQVHSISFPSFVKGTRRIDRCVCFVCCSIWICHVC